MFFQQVTKVTCCQSGFQQRAKTGFVNGRKTISNTDICSPWARKRRRIQDRDGGVVVLSTLFGLSKLFADGGYQGPQFCKAQKKALPHLATEIVKRSDCATGFEVLPKRWVVD